MSGSGFVSFTANQRILEDTIEATRCSADATDCPESGVAVSSSCCNCCGSSANTSCPEPSDVTINQTIIQIADSELRCTHENLTFVNRQATLLNKPISNTCVSLFCNGVLQEPGQYFTVTGRIITLLVEPHVNDNHVAKYKYLASGESTDPISRLGIIEAWGGLPAAIPTGSLLANGDTLGSVASGATHGGEQFRALYDIIGSLYTTPVVVPDFDGDVLVSLPNATDVFQDTTPTLVQFNAIIWYLEAT